MCFLVWYNVSIDEQIERNCTYAAKNTKADFYWANPDISFPETN